MPQKRRLATAAAVFVAALFALGFNLQNVGIASGFIDPVTRLGAQDEAVYTREAIEMATGSGWLTPRYLGRFILFKPPLLMWLSGLSMKLFGIEPLAARLPSLFSGALICVGVFWIVSQSRPLGAAIAAVMLLVSDSLFHTMARVNMTDIPLTACVVSAFAFWLSDTRLRRPAAFWGFSLSVAAAILTKSVAGLLPLITVGLCVVLLPEKPSIKRCLQVCALIAAVALPWHIYQLMVHRNWFLAEYLGVQLVVFGSRPPQTSQENQLAFYLLRIVWGDPALAILLATCLANLGHGSAKFPAPRRLLCLCSIAVFGGALFIFQYRSIQYALPLIPLLAILCAVYSPLFSPRVLRLTLPLLGAAFFAKALVPAKKWSLSFASGSTLSAADPLSSYCGSRREAELIVLLPDDEFYSSVLPLARVRYSWLDAADAGAVREPHLRFLGITLTPAQFDDLPRDRDLYLRRLRAWGLASGDPTGTAIIARNPDEMRDLVRSHPGSDFFLPRGLLNGIEIGDRRIVEATHDRIFLLSRRPEKVEAKSAGWSCDM